MWIIKSGRTYYQSASAPLYKLVQATDPQVFFIHKGDQNPLLFTVRSAGMGFSLVLRDNQSKKNERNLVKKGAEKFCWECDHSFHHSSWKPWSHPGCIYSFFSSLPLPSSHFTSEFLFICPSYVLCICHFLAFPTSFFCSKPPHFCFINLPATHLSTHPSSTLKFSPLSSPLPHDILKF